VNNKWFANRGQIVQTALALTACVIASVKAFPDFQRSQFLTVGSVLFMFIVGSVIASFVAFSLTGRQQKSTSVSEIRPPGIG
jgi:hypothetical protein